MKSVSAPAIERGGDLAAMLTNLQEGEVLFIDEIHRLNPQIEEVSVSGDGGLPTRLDDRTRDGRALIKLDLPKFTLVGATTRAGLSPPPCAGASASSSIWIFTRRKIWKSSSIVRRRFWALRSKRRGAREIGAARTRHTAHRQPPAAARPRLRRSLRRRAHHASAGAARAGRDGG